MTRDFLTEPNQGSIFKIFRDLIMGGTQQVDPSNGKQGDRKNKENKVSNKE